VKIQSYQGHFFKETAAEIRDLAGLVERVVKMPHRANDLRQRATRLDDFGRDLSRSRGLVEVPEDETVDA
jgi:hypothetical protein